MNIFQCLPFNRSSNLQLEVEGVYMHITLKKFFSFHKETNHRFINCLVKHFYLPFKDSKTRLVKSELFSQRSQYLIISIIPSAGCIWLQVQTWSRYSSSRIDISLVFEMQKVSRRNLRSAYGARVGRNACIRCNERTREGRQLRKPLAFHAVSFQPGKIARSIVNARHIVSV